MKTAEYLRILRNEIHSTVMATVDRDGHPVTRVIDIMLVDDHTLYFLTAKGKEFYDQLSVQKYVSLSGMCGGDGLRPEEASLHKRSISVRGTVECIGTEKLDEIFAANPYMAEIYPDPKARNALEVFRMTSGSGEFFDLSTKPITRDSFKVGYEVERGDSSSGGYYITEACIGCGVCVDMCPQKCIDVSSRPLVIMQEHCLHCGNCWRECPVDAVVKRGD